MRFIPVDTDVVGAQKDGDLLDDELEKVFARDESEEEALDPWYHQLHDGSVTHAARVQVQQERLVLREQVLVVDERPALFF